MKMNSKLDDVLNIVIDPALLLSYEFDKLNLDNIPNDIFEEISKNTDSENVILSGNKINKISVSNEKCTRDKSYIPELEVHAKLNPKKDVNGNDESSLYEYLNNLFRKLEVCESYNSKGELSDSDNDKFEFSVLDHTHKETEGSFKLKERAPAKSHSRIKRNRDQTNILYKKCSDKSQFNPEKLKFLAGSSHIELNEQNNHITDHVRQISTTNEYESVSAVKDYFYGEYSTKVVNSPESGYESSVQSGSGSPPLLSLSIPCNLDFIPETVDEQNILEFLVENISDGALNYKTSCNSVSKDTEDKIIKRIINYLKDVPEKFHEFSSDAAFSNDKIEMNVKHHPISKNVETPKRLVYKLDDKVKTTLRKVLSVDKFYAAKEKIYRKMNEVKKHDDIRVIYVEDENCKTSENRTNLHQAVLESRIEDIFCLVEIHKQYNKPLTDINIRDKYGKTALDYAIQNQMTLVVDYLKENTACKSVNI